MDFIVNMKYFLINKLKIMTCLIIVISSSSHALPKYKVKHDKNAYGIARIKLTNETISTLACHVSINGHKKKFVLTAYQDSRWYVAADKQFDYTSFKTWCDLIKFHRHYEKYRR